jgi:hypothetical protein
MAETSQSTPGDSLSMKSHVLNAGSSILQSHSPIKQICAHLCGIHFYNGDRNRQVVAHHYCAHLNEDLRQCLIYDSSDANARLIGVEYVVSEKLFKTFPNEEKMLWHSHVHEVKSGLLVAPGLPDMAEKKLMQELANTYGKTFHFWHTDRDSLPFGIPQLMMSFTSEFDKVEANAAKKFKAETGKDLYEKREARSEIPTCPIDQCTDSWKRGKILQLNMGEESSESGKRSTEERGCRVGGGGVGVGGGGGGVGVGGEGEQMAAPRKYY